MFQAFNKIEERDKELMQLKDGLLTSKHKPKSTSKTKSEAFDKYLKFFYDRPRIKVELHNTSHLFLAHLVYQPKSLIQSCFVSRHRWRHPASALASVHTFPWHRVRHTNFIFGIHMHICPPYIHIKYLVIESNWIRQLITVSDV